MELATLLNDHEDAIVEEAHAALTRARLRSYEKAGGALSRQRLRKLFELVQQSVEQKSLLELNAYVEQVAQERYEAGFDVQEVQTAFNVLEEAIWRRITATVPPEELAQAIGLTGTVLGAGKNTLARQYVALASHRKAPSLDLSELFKGT